MSQMASAQNNSHKNYDLKTFINSQTKSTILNSAILDFILNS